ncbi:MAG: SusC/RagA family TonB-linked outer membrane protein, partial [Thalassobius sp.]|nr:SusC/RagA family TonB-linked outer membrane protein [Thalassovita sp.]
MSKYTLIGIFIQCFLCSMVIPKEGLSQKSIEEIYLDLYSDSSELSDVLETIEENTSFKFYYFKGLIDTDIKLDFEAKNQSLAQILKDLSKKTNLKFKRVNNNIYINKKKLTDIAVKEEFTVDETQFKITGKVTSQEDGEPLPGVSILIKGTSTGTTSDLDGNYTLNVNDNTVLQFSYIGFETQEILVGSQTVINIQLTADMEQLDEVVVVGYGTQKKSNLTGAVTSVKAEELHETPITSIDQGLVGRASGVMVTQTSGMPGAVASIRIRGSSSLQGGNEPLYVIDGFPVYNGSGYGNTGGNARMSGLSTINPSDIESIEILKDASATAIYGARAANGVVLITTKSGKEGKDQITFDAYFGSQSIVKKIDVMDAYNYANLVNEAYTNDGLDPVYDSQKLSELQANPKGTDWQDEIFRTAPIQNYQLTFSGGDKKLNYSISGNYFDQKGIIRNSDFKRFSGRINIDRKINDRFKVGTHLNISRTVSNAVSTDAGGNGGVVTSAMKFNPVLPIFQDEALGIYTSVNTPGIIYPNPVATADEQVRENTMVRLLGNIYGEWEFLPNLTAKVSVGTDLVNTKFDTFIPSNIFESGGVASASINGGYTTNWLNENTLNWTKKLSPAHSISVLGGITFQQNKYEGITASSQEYVNNVLKENALGAGAIYNQPSSSNTEWSLMSYLGRINYNIKEKYLISINARMDGSSRFGDNNKYALFPSGAFAWRLIEEDFVKSMNLFSNLKLRTSYGITGNQEIGLYNSLPTLTNTTYTIGRSLVTGFYPNSIPNPDLKWEKTAQLDIGLDFGFFDDRLRFTTDYYYKKTTDLIYDVAVPFVSGFTSSLQNIGSVENKGIELSIESDIIATNNFSWTSAFNISFNRNKIIELGGEDYKDVGGGDGHLKTGSVHRLIVGEPIGLFYGYVFDGIFQ